MKWWNGKIKGCSSLSKQQILLQQCLAVWPRRGKTLLEINCGHGLFSPLLWECGFDLTATELRPELRLQAADIMGGRAEILAAADDYLPFDDDYFDSVVLHLTAVDKNGIDAAVNEALRVTSRGLAVTFWNSTSLAYALHRIQGSKNPWPGPAHSWWQVWRALKDTKIGRLYGASTLAGPRKFWDGICPLSCCTRMLRLPFGAWGVMRLDLESARPVTPMPLKIKRARLRSHEPIMECGSKNSLNSP
ncbi:MAG: methyltransferase domain-containing protein [Desulfovibrio sp.]|nr:methyltransferase domain-containing protein [Desulfovibrio sp.]